MYESLRDFILKTEFKMFDNLVVCIELVITSLVILNCTLIVSSQDQLKHGLATECSLKGTKTKLVFVKF